MYAKTFIIAASLAAVSPVAADFRVFVGASNDFAAGSPGGAVNAQTPQAYFFNNPPSCNDKGGVTQNPFYNDVSGNKGGYACDGCDPKKALQDQVPTRFEVNDPGADIFDNGGKDVHFTLYKNKDSNTYSMVDTDNNSLGSCTIPEKRQEYNCAHAVIGIDSAVEFFDCKSKLTIKNSN